MTTLLSVLAAAACSFALRAVVPLAAGGRSLPDRAVGLIRLVAPAVMAALLAGSLAAAPSAVLPPRFVVIGVGLAAAVVTRSIPLTLGAGLGAHLLLIHLI